VRVDWLHIRIVERVSHGAEARLCHERNVLVHCVIPEINTSPAMTSGPALATRLGSSLLPR